MPTRKTIASGYPFEDTYGYARAVRVGDLVFVSGTTARSPFLDGDAYVQMTGAIKIIAAALDKAGAEMRPRQHAGAGRRSHARPSPRRGRSDGRR